MWNIAMGIIIGSIGTVVIGIALLAFVSWALDKMGK